MSYLLAVDAGGTSSRAVILDRAGRCLGYGRAGGGNPISSGPALAAQAIVAATRDALAPVAGTKDAAPQVGGALIAMAGALTYASTEWIDRELAPIGVTAPVRLESDLLATFCSGGPELDGYAIVAGTGAAAVRVENGHVVATADGLGWLLGDAGSGFWIGRYVVVEAVAALDNRAEPTALSDLLLAELGIPQTGERSGEGRLLSLATVIERLYTLRPVQLAQFAPLAFQAAAAGDAAAARILREAERAIATTLAALTDASVRGPIVLGGGVLARMTELSEQLAASSATEADPEVRRVPDGTIGAAVLALRAAGIPVDAAVFDTIATSLRALL